MIMSRLDKLRKREEELKEQLEAQVHNGTFIFAKDTLDDLAANQKAIKTELEQQATPLLEDIEFDDLVIGGKYREDSSTSEVDGVYYIHEILYIANEKDSSGLRTVFTKVTYQNQFWYGTVDEDYFK
ncbi:hypothetical protein HONESTABE_123 [Bacillus phage HonestAbe]|nr:hypothetical protein HONESTABE_123 [Bacillus phage HonestAbe]